MPPNEEEIKALEGSPISFRLSGPNERLSHNDQSDDKSSSSGDSTVHSLRPKPSIRLTRKEKGKKKMLEYDNDEGTSDQSESDKALSEGRPQALRSH